MCRRIFRMKRIEIVDDFWATALLATYPDGQNRLRFQYSFHSKNSPTEQNNRFLLFMFGFPDHTSWDSPTFLVWKVRPHHLWFLRPVQFGIPDHIIGNIRPTWDYPTVKGLLLGMSDLYLCFFRPISWDYPTFSLESPTCLFGLSD